MISSSCVRLPVSKLGASTAGLLSGLESLGFEDEAA